MKKRQNLTYTNLREAWMCYSMFKIREITGKIGFQFCKLTFSKVGEQAICKLLIYKENTKDSVAIKFGKGLMTSCVYDSLTPMIECL